MPLNIQEKAIEQLIKQVSGKTFSLLELATDEIKHKIGSGIKEYLNRQSRRFCSTKTILRGATPVEFYDIYFPMRLIPYKYKGEYGGESTQSTRELFKRQGIIAVIGDAGSGKSTLSKHLFLNCIKEQYKIPIFIELRNLKIDGVKEPLLKSFSDLIFYNNIAPSKLILNRMLESGGFVIFLDGFDEISGDEKPIIVDEIDRFITRFDKNNYFLTSRPYTDIHMLPYFYTFQVSDLNYRSGDVDKFIRFQLKDDVEFAEVILESLKKSEINHIDSFLKNPLLLTLFILTFQSNPTVPNQRYIFYRRVIDALFSEHDSKTKFGWKRDWETKLYQEEFEKFLKAFSFISYMDGCFSFHRDDLQQRLSVLQKKLNNSEFSVESFIHDMKVSVSLWLEDGGMFSFSHRSLQEYFSALFIKELDDGPKESIYNKFVEHNKSPKISEFINFLSLCEEMDSIYFNKYYLIPQMEGFLSDVDKSDLTRSIVRQFVDGIEKGHPYKNDVRNGSHSVVFSPKANNYQYFSVSFQKKLSTIIESVSTLTILREAKMERDYYLGGYTKYSFEKFPHIEKSLIEIMSREEVNQQLFLDFYMSIEKEIQERKQVINNEVAEKAAILELV